MSKIWETFSDNEIATICDKSEIRTLTVPETPKRSASTATDIYNEIKIAKEGDLLNVIESQRLKIEFLEQKVKELSKEIDHQCQNSDKVTKKRKISTDIDENETQALRNRVNELTDKINEKDAELYEIRELLAETEYTDQPSNQIIKHVRASIEPATSNMMSRMEAVQATIENKLDRIQKSVDTIIDERLQQNNANPMSYAAILENSRAKQLVPEDTENQSIANKNIEPAELAMKKLDDEAARRSKNLILYGFRENKNPQDDQNNLSQLFQTIKPEYVPLKMYRLGRKEQNEKTIRPVKIILQSQEESEATLQEFASKKEKFDRLYLRKDYSLHEREEIRKTVNEAKRLNANDSGHHWIVRGCPRLKLYLKRIDAKPIESSEKIL